MQNISRFTSHTSLFPGRNAAGSLEDLCVLKLNHQQLVSVSVCIWVSAGACVYARVHTWRLGWWVYQLLQMATASHPSFW